VTIAATKWVCRCLYLLFADLHFFGYMSGEWYCRFTGPTCPGCLVCGRSLWSTWGTCEMAARWIETSSLAVVGRHLGWLWDILDVCKSKWSLQEPSQGLWSGCSCHDDRLPKK
jgi:hypothetical protein